MTFRRKQRWLRRLALGFAFATALFAGKVSAAGAVVDEGGSGSAVQVIPYLSHGILTQEQADAAQLSRSGDELAFRNAIASQDPYLTDVFVRQGESQGGPDGGNLSQAVFGEMLKSRQPAEVFVPGVTDFPKAAVTATPTRPDDRADRFAHSDVPAQTALASGGWNVEWSEALAVGIGALVLVLAFGLGLGYLRRPRIAL